MGKKPLYKANKKPVSKTDLKENVGKVLVNIGQMVFGTLFLGGVLRGEIPHYVMLLAGMVGAVGFTTIGLLLSVREKQDKE